MFNPYPRSLLAARRAGAGCACCLRCFAEVRCGGDICRGGIEPGEWKSGFGFGLRIIDLWLLKAASLVRRNKIAEGLADSNKSNILCANRAARKQCRSRFLARHAISTDDWMDGTRDLGVSHYFTEVDFAHFGLGLKRGWLGVVFLELGRGFLTATISSLRGRTTTCPWFPPSLSQRRSAERSEFPPSVLRDGMKSAPPMTEPWDLAPGAVVVSNVAIFITELCPGPCSGDQTAPDTRSSMRIA